MSFKDLEKIVKGFSNHRRIEILHLLERETELTLDEIAKGLRVNLKTIAEHTRRLFLSGLVEKRYRGRYVLHKITARSKRILTFLRKLE